MKNKKYYPDKYFFGDAGCPDLDTKFTVRLPAPATSLQSLPEIAAQRSLSQPGELIYIWRDTGDPELNKTISYRDAVSRRLRYYSVTCRFLVLDETDIQIYNVRDNDIVSVWLDGEEISE